MWTLPRLSLSRSSGCCTMGVAVSNTAAGPHSSLNPFIAAKRRIAATDKQQQSPSLRTLKPEVIWAQTFLLFLMAHSLPCTENRSQHQVISRRWSLSVMAFHLLARREKPGKPRELTRKAEGAVLPLSKSAPGRRGVSEYRGLTWHKSVQKWAVQLRIDNKASA